MSEYSLVFDDDSSIQFNTVDDALFHVDRQGLSGVVNLVENDENGVPTDTVVSSRSELNDRSQEEKDELENNVLASNEAPRADEEPAYEGGEE